MRLTRQTNYAIRILMYCAANDERLSRVTEIANAYGVSELFLFKSLQPLVEHGMIERRHDPADRRVVLVDYVPGMHAVARRIMDVRRRQLNTALDALTDEEARAFFKGLKEITTALGRVPGEDN